MVLAPERKPSLLSPLRSSCAVGAQLPDMPSAEAAAAASLPPPVPALRAVSLLTKLIAPLALLFALWQLSLPSGMPTMR